MTEQELIAKRIPGISDDEIAAHFSLLPDRYFILTDGSEITLHIQMVNKLLKSITATDSVDEIDFRSWFTIWMCRVISLESVRMK